MQKTSQINGKVVSREASFSCGRVGVYNALRCRCRFGDGRGAIWVAGLNCTGDEQNISACPQALLGVNTCQNWEDASVICAGACTHGHSGRVLREIEVVHTDHLCVNCGVFVCFGSVWLNFTPILSVSEGLLKKNCWF